MTDHPHKTGAAAFGTRRTPPRCPLCRLPIRPTDLTQLADGFGRVHAYCAQEG